MCAAFALQERNMYRALCLEQHQQRASDAHKGREAAKKSRHPQRSSQQQQTARTRKTNHRDVEFSWPSSDYFRVVVVVVVLSIRVHLVHIRFRPGAQCSRRGIQFMRIPGLPRRERARRSLLALASAVHVAAATLKLDSRLRERDGVAVRSSRADNSRCVCVCAQLASLWVQRERCKRTRRT